MSIIFSVDPTALPQNPDSGRSDGSFEKPWGLSHGYISMMYGYEDGPMQGPVSSDTLVSVAAGSRVEFWFVDAKNRPKYVIAPVRVVIGGWTPAGGSAASDLLALLNSKDTPVYLPRFEQNHPSYYSYDYVDPNPGSKDWNKDSGAFAGAWPGGVNCGLDVTPTSPQVRAPFIAMDLADIPGTLSYGLEFKIATNGQDSKGSYWFDPTLVVTKPGDNFFSQSMRRVR